MKKLLPGCLMSPRFLSKLSVQVRLWMSLGPEKFRQLQKLFGGRRVWVPKVGSCWPCQGCPLRDHHIRLLKNQGHPLLKICEKFGLSEKSLYRILSYGAHKNGEKQRKSFNVSRSHEA